MKKILMSVVFVIIVIAGAPFVSGLVMENIVKKSYQEVNKMYADLGSGASVEIIQYDRHFSTSDIELKLNLGQMKGVYGTDEIIVSNKVKHGYTGIVMTSSLDKNQWFSDFVKNKLNGENPLNIITEYSYGGGLESTVTVDAFSLEAAGEIFQVKPGTLVIASDLELKNFASTTSWEGLQIPDKLNIAGVTSSLEMEKISSLIWDGNLSIIVKNTTIDDDSEHVEFANMSNSYALNFDKDASTLSIESAFGIEGLVAGQERVEKAFGRIAVISMDAQSYESFMQSYLKSLYAVLGALSSSTNDPEEMKKIMANHIPGLNTQMMAASEKLLKKDLEFKISDVIVELPEGVVKGDVTLRLKKDMTFMQFLPLVQQPSKIPEIFYLQSDVQFPAQLIADDTTVTNPLFPGMVTGVFVKNGETMQHKAETRDGKLFLNGHEMLLH